MFFFKNKKKISLFDRAPAKGVTSQSTERNDSKPPVSPPRHIPRQPPTGPPLSPKSQSSSDSSPREQQPPRPEPWSVQHLNLLHQTSLNTSAPSRQSPSPFPRFGHALSATASAAGGLFLFGGVVDDSASNDLYMFSWWKLSATLSTTLLQTSGEVPSPRIKHACARIGNVLLTCGGITGITEGVIIWPQDDSLYLLDIGTLDLLTLRATLANQGSLLSSITRVDLRRVRWSRAHLSFSPCRDDGRFQVLRLRWSDRR